MNIVIAGAGDVGFHLAELLERENQNIILIDLDQKLLDYAENHLDIMAIKGDVTSPEILQKANLEKAELFIAATTNESTNLLTAILAKKLGAKKTVARINNPEFLDPTTAEYFASMGVDNMVSPRLLVAQEIKRLVDRNSFTDSCEFDHGLISVLGFTIDNNSSLAYKPVKDLEIETESFSLRVFSILRNGQTIIPKENERVLRSDHVYMVTNCRNIYEINNIIGKTLKEIRRIMIIGGGYEARLTAQLLEKDFSVTMIVNDEERAKKLIEVLNNTLVVNGNWANIDLLKEEGLEQMDAFIALTKNSETNIINCITAEQAGVTKTIASVDNAAYTHVSLNIGIDTIINKKIIAANDIFRYVRKGKIDAIASLHGVNAEILEYAIHRENRVVRVPISELKLPENAAKVVGVVRDARGILPPDDFVLEKGDKVIVFTLNSAIKNVEKVFR